MNDDAEVLATNFGAFATSDMGDDVQVMVVTKDSGCHNGEIMTTDTPQLGIKFSNAVFGEGNVYGYAEAGLTLALSQSRRRELNRANLIQHLPETLHPAVGSLHFGRNDKFFDRDDRPIGRYNKAVHFRSHRDVRPE